MRAEVEDTLIPGCKILLLETVNDMRGVFFSSFQQDFFEKVGLHSHFPEECFSTSRQGVIRGLHFQTPPHAQVKTVQCVAGKALDVVVDLRLGSPAYGKPLPIELDALKPKLIYIPKGCAHGFSALDSATSMFYRTDSPYVPSRDSGIHWDSLGIDWKVSDPVLSHRDRSFISFSDFQSPFHYSD